MNPNEFLTTLNVPDLQLAREWMCDRLKARAISDRVLGVMRELPRHAFVPEIYRRLAYSDLDLWLPDAFVPSPEITARMFDLLDPTTIKLVLELVTGTGYGTCILTALGFEVHTVDYSPAHLANSSQALRGLALSVSSQRIGDPLDGWSEEAPFDAIIVNGSIAQIPEQLIMQLREKTGMLIAPIGFATGPQRLLLVRRGENLSSQIFDLGPVVFPPLRSRAGGLFQDLPLSLFPNEVQVIEAQAIEAQVIEAQAIEAQVIEARVIEAQATGPQM